MPSTSDKIQRNARIRSLIETILPALIVVESNGDKDAIGDDGDALGILQIRLICVNDVNRIIGMHVFWHTEALNPTRAQDMALIYLTHYGRHYEETTFGEVTPEVLARIWNGGPNGWSNPHTLRYWHKVQSVLATSTESPASPQGLRRGDSATESEGKDK